MKKAIIIYGPPGSGKGTQANLIQALLGFYHFDTGKYMEQVVNDPANAKNKIVQREKKNFDTGKLCTPSWALKINGDRVRQLARLGISIILSGAPRTVFETIGDKKNTGLIKIIEKLYGKKNIKIFALKVSPKISIWRNSHRSVCSYCSAPIMHAKGVNTCSYCGAGMRKRSLDKPEIIKVRLEEYATRTEPIFKKLKSLGYKINFINGERLPNKVSEDIIKKLK